MKPVSDAQVRKMMEEMSKDGQMGRAAMKADMDRKTARKYVAAGKLPSEMRQQRSYRTRPDPFVEDWPAVTEMLATTPGLEALTVLELLKLKHPGRYDETHLRSNPSTSDVAGGACGRYGGVAGAAACRPRSGLRRAPSVRRRSGWASARRSGKRSRSLACGHRLMMSLVAR